MNHIIFGDLITRENFRFAKTMPENPHWYTLRKNWINDIDFIKCVMFIRENGYIEYFKGRKYIVYGMNGFKYWTMGSPIYNTILINKAKKCYKADYDKIASEYDNYFMDSKYLEEDKKLFNLLDIKGKVLDIGCGTGLLLKHKKIEPRNYIGIDISEKMLEVFKRKLPEYQNYLINTSFEDFYGKGFDTIVALYGTASYLNQEKIKRISQMLSKNGKAYLMYYKNGYYPATYKKAHIELLQKREHKKQGQLFNNYFINIIKNENLS